jgi:hypothetical protein
MLRIAARMLQRVGVPIAVLVLTGWSSLLFGPPPASSAPASTPYFEAGSAGPSNGHVFDPHLAALAQSSLSCPSTLLCVEVDGAGYAYMLTKGKWSRGRHIANAYAVTLGSVSCPTVSFCMAVGGSSAGGGGFTYIYSRGKWSIGRQFIKDGHGETSVSCFAVADCVVVGWGSPHTYSNGHWTNGPSPEGTMSAVSCPSSACMALEQDRGDAITAFSYSHDLPSNGQSIGRGPSRVSCASSYACVAVNNGSTSIYANGTWSSGEQVDSDFQVTSVSCPSISFCMAVGGTTSTSGTPESPGSTLRYENGTWSSLIQSKHSLLAVSCASATTCIAIDAEGHALTYSNGSWT